jgi:hypothetical protein
VKASYATGQFIGIKKNYAELGLFLPLYSLNNSLLFFDCTAYRFNDAKYASNTGIGLRKSFENGHVAGTNIYYDHLDGKFGKVFQRLGFGFEWLEDRWDVRLNSYINVGRQTHFSKKIPHYNYLGNYHATCQKTQFSISQGADAEIGFSFMRRHQLAAYGAIGPYYYSGHEKHYFGGQARMEINYSFVSLQARTSYDKQNHFCIQAQFQVIFPFCLLFGKFHNSSQTNLRPVYRNGIIFVDDCANWTWNW